MSQTPQHRVPFDVAAFQRRWAEHKFLVLDPLYALPAGLVSRIVDVVPGFLSSEDAAFERDLAGCEGQGIVAGNVFRYPLLCPELSEEWLGPLGCGESIESRAALFREDKIVMGWTDAQVDDHERRLRDDRRRAADWATAYAGCLVTDSRFRRELTALRQKWEVQAREYGFPDISIVIVVRKEDPPKWYAYRMAMRRFYRRWSLERLVTWDLPLPLPATLLSQPAYGPGGLAEAGVHVFLPRYILKRKGILLQEIAQFDARTKGVDHLRGWLGPSRVGRLQFQRMLQLFVYHRLALQRRYAERMKGNMERLDRVFAGYIGLKEDSVKKLRLLMARRLDVASSVPATSRSA